MEAGGAELAAVLLREQGPDASAGIALWEPDLDVICAICLICWDFPNKLANSLGLEQLKL